MYSRLPRTCLSSQVFVLLFFSQAIFCSAALHLPDYAGTRVENEALFLMIPSNPLEESTLLLKTLPFTMSDLKASWDGNRDHIVLEDLSACLGTIPIKGRLEYGIIENPSNWFMKIQIVEWGGNLLDLQSIWNEISPLPFQIKEGVFTPKNRGVEIAVHSHEGKKDPCLRIEGTVSDAAIDWGLGGIELVDLHSEVLFDQKKRELSLSPCQASLLCGKKVKEYLLLGEHIRFYGPNLREMEFQVALLHKQKELAKLQGKAGSQEGSSERSVSLDLLQSHFLQKNISSFSLYVDQKDHSWHLDFSVLPHIKQCRAVYRDGKIEIERLLFDDMELFGEVEPHPTKWICPSLGMEMAPFLLVGVSGEWDPAEEKATGKIKQMILHLEKCPLLQELPCKGVFSGRGDFTFCHQQKPQLSLRLRATTSEGDGEMEGTILSHPKGGSILNCKYRSSKGCFSSPEIRVEPLAKSFSVSCMDAECTNWTPIPGDSTSWQAGLYIPKISLKNFSAQLDDPHSWEGTGSLLFRYDRSPEIQTEIAPVWLPNQGELFYHIQGGKIWLTRLKDGLNKKNSLKIALASSEHSWLDFEGRLAIYLRLRPQNPLLKGFEPISVVLNGDVDNMQCTTHTSKKQRALPKMLKKLPQNTLSIK